MKKNPSFGGNAIYAKLENSKRESYISGYVDRNGVTRIHKVAKVVFEDKIITHKEGSKNVTCKVSCYIHFDIPTEWKALLTLDNYTRFTAIGVAKCADDDTFDLGKGKLIAQAKAENNAYKIAKRMINTLRQQLQAFNYSLAYPTALLDTYTEHNEKFIEKVVDDEIKPKY